MTEKEKAPNGAQYTETTLYTASGEPVTNVRHPPFNPPPDVIIWGNRTFVRRETGKYTEAFAVVLPTIPRP